AKHAREPTQPRAHALSTVEPFTNGLLWREAVVRMQRRVIRNPITGRPSDDLSHVRHIATLVFGVSNPLDLYQVLVLAARTVTGVKHAEPSVGSRLEARAASAHESMWGHTSFETRRETMASEAGKS